MVCDSSDACGCACRRQLQIAGPVRVKHSAGVERVEGRECFGFAVVRWWSRLGGSEMERVVGSEDWLFQMLFDMLCEWPFEMLCEMLLGPVPILSSTWVSSAIPGPVDKSIPKSRPVQCGLTSNPSPRALKSINAASSPPLPFLLPPPPCPSPLSTSITVSGAGVITGGVKPYSENLFHACLPCRLEGLYEHVKLLVRQRSHAGCFLSHFTLAAEQASQVDRSLNGAFDADIGLARA